MKIKTNVKAGPRDFNAVALKPIGKIQVGLKPIGR